jgi:hypothetical protein
MALREHQLGKGTLGYKGETGAYYESKRGLWDRFRWVLAAVCLVLGAFFLVASASPLVTATVVSVTDNGGGTNAVVMSAPDGATSSVTVSYADTPPVGATQQATQLPGGRLVLGDHAAQGRGAALILLALGVGIVLLAVWRIRHPRTPVTTVLAPDDTYALPPHSS